MDSTKLASGDNSNSPRYVKDEKPVKEEIIASTEYPARENVDENPKEITPQMIEDNEVKLKERIAQCRDIIQSLKVELSREKSKLELESKTSHVSSILDSMPAYQTKTSRNVVSDVYTSDMYSACVDSKLNCDESLIEYEKQLQKYQNTLNMAQIEKKNAIRKQMLTKAYKLKLLEVENQCNIELLRVKQSLQCLEPLQMIANKWKTSSSDSNYNLSNYELIPRFPELNANSGSDINSYRHDCDCKTSPEKTGICCKEDSLSSEC